MVVDPQFQFVFLLFVLFGSIEGLSSSSFTIIFRIKEVFDVFLLIRSISLRACLTFIFLPHQKLVSSVYFDGIRIDEKCNSLCYGCDTWWLYNFWKTYFESSRRSDLHDSYSPNDIYNSALLDISNHNLCRTSCEVTLKYSPN